ncbi:MAG: chemotaxis protein CheW [Rhodospirillaceae bacterium]|nr:chemotaxis protein CheW [Rhodospirillales bacterium]
MNPDGDVVLRAFKGEGPLFESMLDERARELAQAFEAEGEIGLDVLILIGAQGRWALPLAAVVRVETLPRPLPVPGLPAPLMGLTLLAGRRCLLADLDGLAAETAPRPADRPGHAVLLRHLPLALAVDRAEAIASVAVPAAMTAGLRRGLLADGAVLLDVGRLAVKAKVGEHRP